RGVTPSLIHHPTRNINRRPSPKTSNFPPKVTTVKAPMVNVVKGVQGNWGNPHHALKDKGVIDSGCSRHMTVNMSYMSDFEKTCHKETSLSFGVDAVEDFKENMLRD
nr:hypothetical protein [Tanacetum cinerariifolium]